MRSKKDAIQELIDRVNALPDQERQVLSRCYGIGRPAQESAAIMNEMGISYEEYTRLKESGLRLMRKSQANTANLNN